MTIGFLGLLPFSVFGGPDKIDPGEIVESMLLRYENASTLSASGFMLVEGAAISSIDFEGNAVEHEGKEFRRPFTLEISRNGTFSYTLLRNDQATWRQKKKGRDSPLLELARSSEGKISYWRNGDLSKETDQLSSVLSLVDYGDNQLFRTLSGIFEGTLGERLRADEIVYKGKSKINGKRCHVIKFQKLNTFTFWIEVDEHQLVRVGFSRGAREKEAQIAWLEYELESLDPDELDRAQELTRRIDRAERRHLGESKVIYQIESQRLN